MDRRKRTTERQDTKKDCYGNKSTVDKSGMSAEEKKISRKKSVESCRFFKRGKWMERRPLS